MGDFGFAFRFGLAFRFIRFTGGRPVGNYGFGFGFVLTPRKSSRVKKPYIVLAYKS